MPDSCPPRLTNFCMFTYNFQFADSWRTWCPVWDRRGTTSVLSERHVRWPDEQVHMRAHTRTPGCLLPSSLFSLSFIHTLIHIPPAHAAHKDSTHPCSHKYEYIYTYAVYTVHDAYIHSDINRHACTHKHLRDFEGKGLRTTSWKEDWSFPLFCPWNHQFKNYTKNEETGRRTETLFNLSI